MSSVTRFIRQINNSNSYVSAATVAATPGTYAYELNPSAGNVVGNYAPGYMSAASANLIAAVAALVASAGGATSLVLRDMGKTVRAPVSSLSGSIGYFRQVQLLSPRGESNGFLGGSSGNVGGVLGGSPNANSPYLTFYIPVVVYGVNAVPAVSANHALNGQM